MTSKAKTYGKKTTKSLAAEFAKLHVSEHGKNVYRLCFIQRAKAAYSIVDGDRAPLIERSSNERLCRSRGQDTSLDIAAERRNTKSPTRVLPQGKIPYRERLDISFSAAKPLDIVSGKGVPSNNPSCGIVVSDSTSHPGSGSPTRVISPRKTVLTAHAGASIEQHDPPAGQTPRARRGKRAVSTIPATLDVEDVDYLKPLTDINGVISTIERTEKWYAKWSRNCKISKIAEGSFGSILRLQNKTDSTQFTIGKLMPLRPRKGPGSKTASFTRVHDAAGEAEMLITMSNFQGFAEFRRAEVLHGRLPPALRQVYKRFEVKHASDSKTTTSFGDNQLWLFLEMSYAGTDIEEILRTRAQTNDLLSVKETWDIFWAVALALARGEENFSFEHRDLQIQNICIKRHCEPPNTQDAEDRLGIEKYTDVEVTIIDYTLSRATVEGPRTIFNPLEDEAIFDGQGADPDEVLQYDTYRNMRQTVKSSSSAVTKGRRKIFSWEPYTPATNILWLDYLLKTLLRHTAVNIEKDRVTAKEDRKLRSVLVQLSEKLSLQQRKSNVSSATDLVVSANHEWRELSESFGRTEDADDKERDGDESFDGDGTDRSRISEYLT